MPSNNKANSSKSSMPKKQGNTLFDFFGKAGPAATGKKKKKSVASTEKNDVVVATPQAKVLLAPPTPPTEATSASDVSLDNNNNNNNNNTNSPSLEPSPTVTDWKTPSAKDTCHQASRNKRSSPAVKASGATTKPVQAKKKRRVILEDSDDDDDDDDDQVSDANPKKDTARKDAAVTTSKQAPAKKANESKKNGLAKKAKVASKASATDEKKPVSSRSSKTSTASNNPTKKKPGLAASGWGFLDGSFQGAAKNSKKATAKRNSTSSDSGKSPSTGATTYIKQPYSAGDDLPILVQPQDFFNDMVSNQLCEQGRRTDLLQPLLEAMHGRTLKIATMCSGTESPVLALDMIAKAIEDVCQSHQLTVGGGKDNDNEETVPSILLEHVFSCEIEPFKQSYIERNFQPKRLFRDIRELGNDQACTAFGAMIPVPNSPGCVDLLVAGTSCVDFSNLNNSKVCYCYC